MSTTSIAAIMVLLADVYAITRTIRSDSDTARTRTMNDEYLVGEALVAKVTRCENAR